MIEVIKPSIEKLGYNTIPEQKLTYANQLTIREWNIIVNTLRIQTNNTIDYLRQLHQWLEILDDDYLARINNRFSAIETDVENIRNNYALTSYVDTKISESILTLYKAKGSATISQLTSMPKSAYMQSSTYNVTDGGVLYNYDNTRSIQVLSGDNVLFMWNGGSWYWDKLAATIDVQSAIDEALEPYATTDYVNNNSNKTTTAVVKDALTNLSGWTLSAYEQTRMTVGGYTVIKITRDGNNLTKEQASSYLEHMIGTKYVPEFNYNTPQNSFMVFADLSIWKPQWDFTNGMLLYLINDIKKSLMFVESTDYVIQEADK